MFFLHETTVAKRLSLSLGWRKAHTHPRFASTAPHTWTLEALGWRRDNYVVVETLLFPDPDILSRIQTLYRCSRFCDLQHHAPPTGYGWDPGRFVLCVCTFVATPTGYQSLSIIIWDKFHVYSFFKHRHSAGHWPQGGGTVTAARCRAARAQAEWDKFIEIY